MASLGQTAFAQAIENLKIVTGFAPGGTSDTTCRRVATRMSPGYAGVAVVENRSGAGGQIAVQYVKEAKPDGATLLQTPTSILTIYPHIYKKLPYDPMVDLTPASLACVFDFGRQLSNDSAQPDKRWMAGTKAIPLQRFGDMWHIER